MPIADTQKALEMNAKSLEVRRLKRDLRILDAPQTQTDPEPTQISPGEPLHARAQELDALLARLKEQLRNTTDPQDALRLCQAIDRLEQSWARYAGVPTPPKGRASSRRSMSSPPEPLD